MPIGDLKINATQEELAIHQLDRAIRLFLNESDYICAITLAGAADGILGGLLKKENVQPAISSHIESIQAEENISSKDLGDNHFNLLKNALKHNTKPVNIELSFAPETEAIYLITRAIDNSIRMRHELTGWREQFVMWVYANRKDLIGP